MESVRIVALSDTHNHHEELQIPECDILLHAGDITGHGSKVEVFKFLNWFDRQPAKHKFLVPGNHDAYLAEQKLQNFASVQLLYGQEAITVLNLKIFGVPGVPLPFESCRGGLMWAFGAMDHELQSTWQIPPDTDILVTHCPPKGFLDKHFSGKHIGSKTLMDAVNASKVKLHVFGHIHESAGYLQADGRTFVNAAVMNEVHVLKHKPTVIDFTPEGITITSSQFD